MNVETETKESLINKLQDAYVILVKECIELGGLFKEENYYCGLQRQTKLEVPCQYRKFVQCLYKNDK